MSRAGTLDFFDGGQDVSFHDNGDNARAWATYCGHKKVTATTWSWNLRITHVPSTGNLWEMVVGVSPSRLIHAVGPEGFVGSAGVGYLQK